MIFVKPKPHIGKAQWLMRIVVVRYKSLVSPSQHVGYMKTKLVHVYFLLMLSAVVLVIYLPGLHGPYVLDDGENIYLNDAIALKDLSPTSLYNASRANESGPLRRPIASLSFAFNYYFSGGFANTFPFKLTNLVIHIGNAILVYCLTFLLLQTPALRNTPAAARPVRFAALAATLWAIHPIQLTNVLYVVQRMNSLSAFWVLCGLLIFMHGRKRVDQGGSHAIAIMAIGIISGLFLGLMSKENASLLPLFALTIEYTCYQRCDLESRARMRLYIFYMSAVLIPAVIFVIYLVGHPDYITSSYAVRHFTLYERLLTEARVLWFYVGLLFLPTPSRLGLFHDDISISTSLLAPPITLFAVTGWLILLVAALVKTKKYPVISFCILWFLAGHVLESSVFGLELAYEHRNYLPSMAFFFLLSFALLSILEKLRTTESVRFLLALFLLLALGFSTWNRAGVWSNRLTIAETDARYHPSSMRANDFAAKASFLEAKDIDRAIYYTLRTIVNAPQEAGLRIDLRLLLAAKEAEINRLLVQSQVRTERLPGNIKIGGLPTAIKITSDGRRVYLSHDSSLDGTITNLLKIEPITVHTVVALEDLRQCVIETPRVCNSLQVPALNWLTAATDNPRSSNDYRAIVLRDTAMLYAYRGDYGLALRYMEKAAEMDPSVPVYQLAKTEYLIRTGNLNQAKLMLNNLTSAAHGFSQLSYADRTTLDKLAKLYASAIEQAP